MWTVVGDSPETGMPVKVTFDGTLTAEKATMALLKDYADTWEFVGVTPVGPVLKADLEDESASFLLAMTVLARAQIVAGDVPPLPDVPERENAVY